MTQNIYDNQAFSTAMRSSAARSTAGRRAGMARHSPHPAGFTGQKRGRSRLRLRLVLPQRARTGRRRRAGAGRLGKMLAKAREMTADAGIEYRRQDLAQLQLPPESYDLVYSSLTLHYLEDLAALFTTVYAALKPGGQFIFTAEHPIYTAPAQQGWLNDGNGQKSRR